VAGRHRNSGGAPASWSRYGRLDVSGDLGLVGLRCHKDRYERKDPVRKALTRLPAKVDRIDDNKHSRYPRPSNALPFSCKGRYVMVDSTTAGAARRPSFT
jgi:hypothetical protein